MCDDGWHGCSSRWHAWKARNTCNYVDHELAGIVVPLWDHKHYLRRPTPDNPGPIVLAFRRIHKLNGCKRKLQRERAARTTAGNRATWDKRKEQVLAAFESATAAGATWSRSPSDTLESDLNAVNAKATVVHRAAEVFHRAEVTELRQQFFAAIRSVTSNSGVELHKAATRSRGNQSPRVCDLCDTWGVSLRQVTVATADVWSCDDCNRLHSRLFCLSGPRSEDTAASAKGQLDLAARALLEPCPSPQPVAWHPVFSDANLPKE